MARERDALQYLAFVARIIRTGGRRVGQADEFELAELLALHDVVDEAIQIAIDGQREHGKSWAAIADATGTTRQGAQQRYGRRRSA
jgi:CRP-like cAMP-binding protein